MYLRVTVVCVPGRPERLLTTQIPHDKMNIVPDHLLHVAPDGRGRVDDLVHQELVQNCRFSSVV